MSMRGDYVRFSLGGTGRLDPEARPLPSGRYEDAGW
jgi:hypothetical protein